MPRPWSNPGTSVGRLTFSQRCSSPGAASQLPCNTCAPFHQQQAAGEPAWRNRSTVVERSCHERCPPQFHTALLVSCGSQPPCNTCDPFQQQQEPPQHSATVPPTRRSSAPRDHALVLFQPNVTCSAALHEAIAACNATQCSRHAAAGGARGAAADGVPKCSAVSFTIFSLFQHQVLAAGLHLGHLRSGGQTGEGSRHTWVGGQVWVGGGRGGC